MFISRQQPPKTITLIRSQSFITADKILISIHRIAMIIWIVKIIRIAGIIFTKRICLSHEILQRVGVTQMSRDKTDYSLPPPKGRIWIAWNSRTKTRYNDLASTDHRSTQGRFSFHILTSKVLIFFPTPSPTSPSQTQTLPHYILVKSIKTGGKLRKKLENYFFKCLWREMLGKK